MAMQELQVGRVLQHVPIRAALVWSQLQLGTKLTLNAGARGQGQCCGSGNWRVVVDGPQHDDICQRGCSSLSSRGSEPCERCALMDADVLTFFYGGNRLYRSMGSCPSLLVWGKSQCT